MFCRIGIINKKRLDWFMPKLQLRPPVLWAGLILLVILIPWIYVSNEDTFYYWDYANYHNLARQALENWGQSPANAMQAIADSMANNYNSLFTLPLLPFLLLFGSSRVAFIISLSVMYLLPFAVAMGLLASKLFPTHPKAGFWGAAYLTVLIPMTWVSVLRGYPDIGSEAAIAFGVVVFVSGYERRRWRNFLLAGFLLGLSVLLRRHFIYQIIGFFGMGFIYLLMVGLRNVTCIPLKNVLAEVFGKGLTFLVTGMAFVVTLFLLGQAFLNTATAANYSLLYSSYTDPWYVVLERFIHAYGWVVFFLAGLGWLALFLDKPEITENSMWVSGWGISALISWCFLGQHQANNHSVHFAPFIILGLFIFLFKGFTSGRVTQRSASGVVTIVLIFNFMAGLTPWLGTVDGTLSENWPPLVREDKQQIAELLSDLRDLSGDGGLIYVVSSSSLLNRNLLWNAEVNLYGKENARLNMVSSEVDSREIYPIGGLARAGLVLVVNPIQHHLSLDRQQLVQTVYDLFQRSGGLAKEFERLPKTYLLDGGAEVVVYRRVGENQFVEFLETISLFRKNLPSPSLEQPEWYALNAVRFDLLSVSGKIKSYSLEFSTQGAGLFYLLPFPENFSLEFTPTDPACTVSTALRFYSPDGSLVNTLAENRYHGLPEEIKNTPGVVLAFEIAPKSPGAESCKGNLTEEIAP